VTNGKPNAAADRIRAARIDAVQGLSLRQAREVPAALPEENRQATHEPQSSRV
jgi:hypothetical protein